MSALAVYNSAPVKILATAAAVGLVFLGVKWYTSDERDQKKLKKEKVLFNPDNIPHYTIEQVREYAGKSRRGELASWGTGKNLPQQAEAFMDKNNLTRLYWHPGNMVAEAYKQMNGASMEWLNMTVNYLFNPMFLFKQKELDPREVIWKRFAALNSDQLRYVHNFWIENASEGSSFYEWVNGEWSNSVYKSQLLAKLSQAGVGQFVNKKN